MDDAYYPGEEPIDGEIHVDSSDLSEEEKQLIAFYVHNKAEYLEHRFDDVERMERVWKFIGWCIENNRSYDEFGIEDNGIELPYKTKINRPPTRLSQLDMRHKKRDEKA